MSNQPSNVLVVTKWRDDDGTTRVRLLAADLPQANELKTDETGALRWIQMWLGMPSSSS